eukprot:TRINITY_DN10136_c0_g1_i1.p1 TRINITY_DN10136_c0_g1~~TRINITY_DN10136_c0_g1_i1.p1  ORF type:complete len:742 (+),score=218.04 TRINITY_DN10136_c0_g1_i1:106-2226(+)
MARGKSPEKLKAVVDKLTPAPSVSRTGKMAHSAMHTDALVRGGVAALAPKQGKKGKNTITLAEIIDPSQLDSFGTALPGVDGGRGKEMCSSPRGHPELQTKLTEIMVSDRTVNFKKKMELKEEAELVEKLERELRAATSGGMAPSAIASPKSPATARSMAASARGSPRKPATAQQSSCFQTVDRWMASKYSMKTPPVGHYRPKYCAVDGSVKVLTMHQKPPVRNLRKIKNAMQESVAELNTSAFDKCKSMLKSVVAIKSAGSGSQLMSPTVEPIPPPGQPPADARSPQRCLGYDAWLEKHRAAETEGTSAFRSAVPTAENRPTPLPVSPDKFYYPYNECGKGRKPPPRAGHQWQLGTSRKNKIVFKGYSDKSDAPDVMYDVQKPTSPVGNLSMSDQVARNKAAGDGQQMASRKVIRLNAQSEDHTLHKFPASHLVYNTEKLENVKFKKTDTMVSFDRSTTRDQRPTEVQKPKKLVDPVIPYEMSPDRKSPDTVNFHNQTARQPLMNVLHDLEYANRVPGKSPVAADLDRTGGHQGLFAPSITLECNYDPSVASVKPRSNQTIHLKKMLSRDEVKTGVKKPVAPDTFYETDPATRMMVNGVVVEVPLKGSRTQGNPMIHSHISREKRSNCTAVRKSSPDKYYDYKVPAGHVAGIDFKRVVSREDKSIGRLQPTSPKQETAHPRSPGCIYEPQSVEKHIPVLVFSPRA